VAANHAVAGSRATLKGASTGRVPIPVDRSAHRQQLRYSEGGDERGRFRASSNQGEPRRTDQPTLPELDSDRTIGAEEFSRPRSCAVRISTP
jgi:hypothetical protein